MRILALTTVLLLGSSLTAMAEMTPKEMTQGMCSRFSAAFNAKDLNAQLALYTDDAVRVGPEGTIIGSEAIKKNFTDVYKIASNHRCTVDQAAPIGKDAFWGGGTWEVTVTSDKGPEKVGGFWSAVFTGGWPTAKCMLETWNNKVEPPPPAKTN